VFAILAQEEFILAKCAATGSLSAQARVSQAGLNEGQTLTSIRVLPADLPAPARSLVGDTIKVTETQVWSAPEPNGSRTATVSVEFSGPMGFVGTLELTRPKPVIQRSLLVAHFRPMFHLSAAKSRKLQRSKPSAT